jgi:hypothetical protein
MTPQPFLWLELPHPTLSQHNDVPTPASSKRRLPEQASGSAATRAATLIWPQTARAGRSRTRHSPLRRLPER